MNTKNRRRRRLLLRLAEMQANLCFHCGQPMVLPDPGEYYENGSRNGDDIASYDHLVPRALGGQGGCNLVIAHRGCNSRRGHTVPTEEEAARLAQLNERRKHLFSINQGRISAASFGEVTSSSIVLAEVLNDLGDKDASKQRRLTCRFMHGFYRDVRALDPITAFPDWSRLLTMVRDHHLQRLYADDCLIMPKDFVANCVHSIVRNRSELRRSHNISG